MVLTAQQLEAMMPDASQLLSDDLEMESFLHYMQMLILISITRNAREGSSTTTS